jgi:hypothetical protein
MGWPAPGNDDLFAELDPPEELGKVALGLGHVAGTSHIALFLTSPGQDIGHSFPELCSLNALPSGATFYYLGAGKTGVNHDCGDRVSLAYRHAHQPTEAKRASGKRVGRR